MFIIEDDESMGLVPLYVRVKAKIGKGYALSRNNLV